jgi:hypothetical protein
MIEINGLANGARQTVDVQGQYLYLDILNKGGVADITERIFVSIKSSDNQVSDYLLKQGDMIDFGQGMAELSVINQLGGTIDVLFQNGWGRFTPRVDVGAVTIGTVDVGNPAGSPVPVYTPVDLDVDVASLPDVIIGNTAADPVPVVVQGALNPRRVVGQFVSGLTATIANGAAQNFVVVPIALTVPPSGWRIAGVRCLFALDAQTDGSAGENGIGLVVMLLGSVTTPALADLPVAISGTFPAGDVANENGITGALDESDVFFDGLKLEFLATQIPAVPGDFVKLTEGDVSIIWEEV